MILRIEINCNNAAFGESESELDEIGLDEIIRLLRVIANQVSGMVGLGLTSRRVLDTNGNTVGSWALSED